MICEASINLRAEGGHIGNFEYSDIPVTVKNGRKLKKISRETV
jgi:hypothetical protein